MRSLRCSMRCYMSGEWRMKVLTETSQHSLPLAVHRIAQRSACEHDALLSLTTQHAAHHGNSPTHRYNKYHANTAYANTPALLNYAPEHHARN